jgi:hypothetical protein
MCARRPSSRVPRSTSSGASRATRAAPPPLDHALRPQLLRHKRAATRRGKRSGGARLPAVAAAARRAAPARAVG